MNQVLSRANCGINVARSNFGLCEPRRLPLQEVDRRG
jgi:hypothetical protein